MNISDLQAALNSRGQNPPLKTDGIPGRKTMAAIDAVLASDKGVDARYLDWPDARRHVAFEQIVYRDLKIEVGAIDDPKPPPPPPDAPSDPKPALEQSKG